MSLKSKFKKTIRKVASAISKKKIAPKTSRISSPINTIAQSTAKVKNTVNKVRNTIQSSGKKSLVPSTKRSTPSPINSTRQSVDSIKSVATPVVNKVKDTISKAAKNSSSLVASATPFTDKASSPIRSTPNIPANNGLDFSSSDANVAAIKATPQYQQEQMALQEQKNREQGIVSDYMASLNGARPGSPESLGMGTKPEPVVAQSPEPIESSEKPTVPATPTTPASTYSFNPTSIANTNATANRFQMALDSGTKNPWKYNSDPQAGKQSILESYSSQFAKDFASPQEFYDNLSSNPELQKSLDSYFKSGGTPAMIANKIQVVTNDIVPEQDTATYLDKIQAQNTPEGMKALMSLSPEKQLAQEEIMRQTGMAKELQDLYFGTPEKKGILEQQMEQAKEEKKLIERKQLAEEKNLRQQAQYEIDKNDADAKFAAAEIELNRLNAKNYMTGKLASLGALITTGAAPLALAKLDQSYQQQKQVLDSKLSFANRDIQIKLTKGISDLELERDADIQSINEDLSKSEADIRKEIFKTQQKAADDIYNITSKYAGQLRTQTDKYIAESKANADKYNSNFMLLAGKGVPLGSIPGMIDANGRVITSKLPASIFAKGGKGAGGFTAQEQRKLEQAGIDPSTDRQAALDYLYGKGDMGKPSFSGEQIELGDGKRGLKAAKELEEIGVISSDIVELQNLLNQGYSLKQVAQESGMPANIFNALSKYLVTS
jgi:hypothetical protein